MDTKTMLNKVSEIESKAYNFTHLKDVAKVTKNMSSIPDITTLQIYIRGLAITLEDASTELYRVWSKAYDLERDLEKELAEDEPTIDDLPIDNEEVTE